MNAKLVKKISSLLVAVMVLTIFSSNLVSSQILSRAQFSAGNGSFSLSANPFKYSSYYQDAESNLYYLQARYYSPLLLRFISRDTYDLTNRYAYCDGNPVNKLDPTGHNCLSFTLATLAAAAAFTAFTASVVFLPSPQTLWGAVLACRNCAFLLGGAGLGTVDALSELMKNKNEGWKFSWDNKDTLTNALNISSVALLTPCTYHLIRAGTARKLCLYAKAAYSADSSIQKSVSETCSSISESEVGQESVVSESFSSISESEVGYVSKNVTHDAPDIIANVASEHPILSFFAYGKDSNLLVMPSRTKASKMVFCGVPCINGFDLYQNLFGI